ncbi:MAG: DNA adenine methylase [Candidatus Cloacimonadaceae bacterium]
MEKIKMKPFVKWAGGKAQLLSEIRKHYPAGLGTAIRRYAEPFVGGGAVLFDILNHYDIDAIYISDSNAELINSYRVIKDDVELLISYLNVYQKDYLPLADDKRKQYYYEKRTRYNALKQEAILDVEMASLFIFLNKTCFNGLYRVNAKGEYNVPMGSYKAPLICDAENLCAVSKGLSKVQIECADYRQSSTFIDANTFVYFDPPYRPLNATSSFTAYTKDSFNDVSQKELAEYIGRLSLRGARIVASNSDPKNTAPDDDFFDELYAQMNIMRIPATRMINSDASARGKINELLIRSHER